MDKRCRNAFDTLCMSEEKKEQVFEDICEKCEKRKTHRFPKIAVAACILAVAVPTVGIAGEKISAYVMSLKKDQMHAVFQISDSADEGTGEQKVALEYVKLNVTDLVGYTREQDKGLDEMNVIHFRSEEYPDTQGLYIEILQIDCDTDQFYERNVMNTQEMVWNGQKAVYMKQNHLTGSQYEAGTEGKEVAVFYENYGYALLIQGVGMENMSDQEFLTLVQSFTLSPATEETADVVQSMSEYIAQMKHREQIDATENEVLRSFPTDKMCDVGDTQIYNGISYRIDAVEVRDNLRNLDQHGYQDEVSEKLKKGIGVDEKLNLQSYERETITFGNGYDQPLTYVEKTEHVTPKLVLVTMTIQNISYEDEEDMLPVANPLTYIKKTADHTEFDWREFERGDRNLYYRDNMPIWISDSEGGSWYYCKKMKKGDCVTLQLGYLVDEDMLDKMVMELNCGDGLHDGAWNFIDMRSAAE